LKVNKNLQPLIGEAGIINEPADFVVAVQVCDATMIHRNSMDGTKKIIMPMRTLPGKSTMLSTNFLPILLKG
jgi:hypothetical protein